MFNIQKHLRHVVLALSLAAASLTAGATVLPTFHIGAVDTASADIAYVDVVFGSINGAAAATATLSHLVGSPLTELDREGAVSSTADSFMIDNVGSYNDLFLQTSGPFAFDLNFSEGFLSFASNFGSMFSIALLDSDFNVIGDPNGALSFSLTKTGIVVASTSTLLSVTQVPAVAVPEPSSIALLGLGLAGFGLARRKAVRK